MVVHNVLEKQRALIFQGGGALGAYEAGAFKAFCKKIPEIDAKNQETGRPLFDIIAGTSIGAINAAILVSHFKEDNSRNWRIYKTYRIFGITSLRIHQRMMLNLEFVGGMKYTKMIKMLLHLKLLEDTILQSTSCRMELIGRFLSLS